MTQSFMKDAANKILAYALREFDKEQRTLILYYCCLLETNDHVVSISNKDPKAKFSSKTDVYLTISIEVEAKPLNLGGPILKLRRTLETTLIIKRDAVCDRFGRFIVSHHDPEVLTKVKEALAHLDPYQARTR